MTRTRTRIAPSPTGDPHVGTGYVALINYLFAKKTGGDFILRIEDTDLTRSSRASEDAILESLRWLGLAWDEGPDIGGPHGPYRQSDRAEIYRAHAETLLQRGAAFKCFCSPERLDAVRREQRRQGQRPRYDGHCLGLDDKAVQANLAQGLPYVVRMKVSGEGSCVVQDMRRGPIEIAWDQVDMQVLLKSDGMPTYHLANVVDDHLMEISHVIRGEEWISSAPKHALLYSAFGWTMPALCHLPLLRNPDHSKLSKRKNPTGILYFRRMGYLPEALRNFLGLFALSTAEGEEMMPLAELIARFDLGNISMGGPIFDFKKLNWLNARYIRETLDKDAFLERVRDWAFDRARLDAIAGLAQPRVEVLSDLGPLLSFLFSGVPDIAAEKLREAAGDVGKARQLFQLALWRFDEAPAWEVEAIERILRAVADQLGLKFRDGVKPFYVAITGQTKSLPLFDSMAILGRDLCRERLRKALAALGPPSKAELEAWRAAATTAERAGEAIAVD